MTHPSGPSAPRSAVDHGVRPERYDPLQIEPVWRARWKSAKLFEVADPTHDQLSQKYYVLEMLPYPSGRIHMGHVRNYAIGDVLARFHRMRGRHVLHPMGWDAFGMPAENAAIERGRHPADWTLENIAAMKAQLEPLGFTYDWSREVATCNADYYRWEQLIFTRMLKKGLAYRKNAVANWCNHCATVLANEQVVDGKCWRCDGEVVQRELRQWFLRITKYADELLEGLGSLKGGWPDQVLAMQRNWIGRSQGAKVRFAVAEEDRARAGVDAIEIFTTRPDTLFGVTFMSVAPEHPVAKAVAEHSPEVRAFLEKMSKKTDLDRTGENAEKEGIALGVHVVHPLTGAKVPVFAGSFVLMGYGTGAVMAVPAHDARDFAFARQHALPLVVVIQPADGAPLAHDGHGMTEAYTGPGTLVESGTFTGLSNDEGKSKIAAVLTTRGIGEETITYRLRDWLISRQRYWGCPIPVIYGEDGEVMAVPEADLPVVLPRDVVITGEGGSPLERHPTFSKVRDPRDPSKMARRETDTFDTFFESSWYFLRYTSAKFDTAPFDPAVAGAWMAVDQYIGGVEHAVLHLLYARFFHKVLIDLGFLPTSTPREPFRRLLAQGMVCMQTSFVRDEKGGQTWLYPEEVDESGRSRAEGSAGQPVEHGRVEKMSKRKRNVVDPVPMVARYGADTARLFVLFAAPPEAELIWTDAGVEGANRFLGRVFRVVRDIAQLRGAVHGEPLGAEATDLRRKLHQTVVKVTGDLEERHQFNTAIAAMMELVNVMVPLANKASTASADTGGTHGALREAAELLVQLLSPFAPHLADELWTVLGHSGFLLSRPWPKADVEAAREDEVEIGVQINGRVRGRIKLANSAGEAAAVALAGANAELAPYLEGKTAKKIVFVAGRILNFIL